MYALEDEPESQHRWRRLGVGALLTAAVLVALGYGAQRFEPARRLLQQVVQLTVVTELPKPEAPPPPRTEPPPPPPKRVPPQKSKPPSAAQQPKPAPATPEPQEPLVGLDDGSFGDGAGPSFQAGTTQLGAPASVARAPVAAAPPAPARLVPARLPERVESCRYHQRAQRLGLQGLMVIETEIDERGRVTRTKLRKGLEEELDQRCLEAVRSARFEPATLGGKPVASTRLLRLRFELDR